MSLGTGTGTVASIKVIRTGTGIRTEALIRTVAGGLGGRH